MSVHEAILRERRKLDKAWNEKYPRGMFYAILTVDGFVRYGCLSQRPTSGAVHTKWKVGGYYFGKSFTKTRVHYTTDGAEKLIARLDKLGIPFSEQRTEP